MIVFVNQWSQSKQRVNEESPYFFTTPALLHEYDVLRVKLPNSSVKFRTSDVKTDIKMYVAQCNTSEDSVVLAFQMSDHVWHWKEVL